MTCLNRQIRTAYEKKKNPKKHDATIASDVTDSPIRNSVTSGQVLHCSVASYDDHPSPDQKYDIPDQSNENA